MERGVLCISERHATLSLGLGASRSGGCHKWYHSTTPRAPPPGGGWTRHQNPKVPPRESAAIWWAPGWAGWLAGGWLAGTRCLSVRARVQNDNAEPLQKHLWLPSHKVDISQLPVSTLQHPPPTTHSRRPVSLQTRSSSAQHPSPTTPKKTQPVLASRSRLSLDSHPPPLPPPTSPHRASPRALRHHSRHDLAAGPRGPRRGARHVA